MNIASLKERARAAAHETSALYYAFLDRRTPVAAKLIAGLTAAYALSPIDLIPDFIPVLGMLDDILIVPAGVALAIRLIPPAVMDECRTKAAEGLGGGARRAAFVGGALVVGFWALILTPLIKLIIKAVVK